MTTEEFWKIVNRGKDSDQPEDVLRKQLASLDADALIEFQRCLDEAFGRAYRWDLWGAAQIIENGCSDDTFMDFRWGLIARGKRAFEAALADPEALADIPVVCNQMFGAVALDLYEEKVGAMMRPSVRHPDDPAGEEWDIESAEELAARLPGLWERYAE